MYKRNYFIFPIMETVYDSNRIHKEIVFRYFCKKCERNFINKKEYDIHYCGNGKLLSNE